MDSIKLKQLNKETVTWAIMENFNFKKEVVEELVEVIWNSDNLLESFQNIKSPEKELVGMEKIWENIKELGNTTSQRS